MDLDAIMRKLKRLLAVTAERGATANEAAIAAQAARAMMDEHGLTLADVETMSRDGSGMEQRVCDDIRRVSAWETSLSVVLATGFDCRSFVRYGGGERKIGFLGFAADVAVATFLYQSLRREIAKEAGRTWRAAGGERSGISRHRFAQSFGLGATRAIKERLAGGGGSGSRAGLILAKNAALDAAVDAANWQPDRPSRGVEVEQGAYLRGLTHGRRACLDGRPLPDRSEGVAGHLN